MAELLYSRELERPQHEGHASVVAGRIATSGGEVSFLTENPEGAVEDHYYFVGGLMSGCAYNLPACETAKFGKGATMVRHANRRYARDVLDIDAAEVAETIETLSRDARVHIIGHSKGTKVGLLAAARVPSDIDVASVTLINPVLGTGVNRENFLRKARNMPGVALSLITSSIHPTWSRLNAQKGATKEILARSPAVLAETVALLGSRSISRADVEVVQERPQATHRPLIVMAYGTSDKLTRQDDIEQAVEAEGIVFDATLRFEQAGQSDHLAVVNNPAVIRAILGVEDLVVRSMRAGTIAA